MRLPNGVFNPYTGIRTNLLFFTKGQPTTEIWYYEHPYPEGAKSYNKSKPIRIEEFKPEKEWWKNRAENEHAWRVSIDQIKANNYNLDLKNPSTPSNEPGDVDHLLPAYEKLLVQIAETRAQLKRELHHALTASISPTDLRKTILNLAVRGRLVPQADDTSAMKALQSCGVDITEEMVPEEEQRYPIPQSWIWIRFAAIGDQRLGKMLDEHKNRGELKPYLRNTNVQWMRFELDDLKQMRIEAEERDELRLRRGDLLICEGGEPGRCAIWKSEMQEMYFQKALHRVRPCSAVIPEFLALNLQVDCQNGVLEKLFTGATIKHLTGRSLRQYAIPIPPLREQQRIITEVERLLGMVDRLEEQLRSADGLSRDLSDAVVHEILTLDEIDAAVPSAVLNLAATRAAVVCYGVQRLVQNPNFGRTMNMKIGYLAEAHLGLSLGWQPERQAAGPWDPWISEFDAMGRSEGWFTVTEKSLGNGRSKFEYVPGAALGEKAAEAAAVLGKQKDEFDRMLSLFADRSTEEAEIIATLFAAWNDFLIDGKSPTDEEIIREVRENWHPQKERFSASLLARWLGWMRANRLVPKGREPRTIQQFRLQLR